MPIASNAVESQRIMTRISAITYPADIRAQGSVNTKRRIDKFIRHVGRDRNQLNALIDEYNGNALSDGTQPLHVMNANKKSTLRAIYEIRKNMENKYPDDYIGTCPEYQREIQNNLFSQLKTHFAACGVLSLHEDCIYERQAILGAPNTMPEILANMSSDKVSRLIHTLSEGSKHHRMPPLTGLYNPREVGHDAFERFLQAHSIAVLGGKNSLNFKVTHQQTGESFVLKVENRMNKPKAGEAHLRADVLRHTLTPIAAERRATFINSAGEPITRTLLVTEFCKGGDLRSSSIHANKMTGVCSIYRQMGAILIAMESANYAFLDMKNSNWLLDEKGALRIADTKGFVPTLAGQYLRKNAEDHWYDGYISTRKMNPPELTSREFNANKAHAYMLGKNIYEYLTDCHSNLLLGMHDANDHYFDSPIFKGTPYGQALKQLIQDMIKPDPSARISVQDAMIRLEQVSILNNIHALKNECIAILCKIKTQTFGPDDTLMDEYVMDQMKKMWESQDTDGINALIRELNTVEKEMPAIAVIQSIILSFREKKLSFMRGTEAKADRIELAMRQVPVAERGSVMESKTEVALNVQAALASHRYVRVPNLRLKDDPTPKERKPARSFREIKEKMEEMKAFDEAKDDKLKPKR